MSFLIKLENMLLKFIWKNKPARITNKQKIHLKTKEHKVGTCLTRLKNTIKASIIKTVWCMGG